MHTMPTEPNTRGSSIGALTGSKGSVLAVLVVAVVVIIKLVLVVVVNIGLVKSVVVAVKQ